MRICFKTSGFLLAVLWWLGIAVAQAAELARLPFYEARKGSVQIYILGTMHVGKPDEPLRQDIAQALAKSSRLVMEASGEEMAKMAPLMLSYLCEDACLRRQVSEKTWEKLSTQGMLGAAGLDHMPAWMVSTLLASIDYMKLGLSPQSGSEQRLMQIWGQRPTQGLESAKEQMQSLAALNGDVQREMLEGYLNLSEEKRATLIRKLYQIWQEGDADALYNWYRHMNEEEGMSSRALQEINEVLVVSRNRRFVERLQPHLAPDKPVFLAVGALHLGGNKGVLALLRAQGFSVTAR